MILNSSRPLLVYGLFLVCQLGLVKSNAYVYKNASHFLTAPATSGVIAAAEEVKEPNDWDKYVKRGLESYSAWKLATTDVPYPHAEAPDDVFSKEFEGAPYLNGAILEALGRDKSPERYSNVLVEERCSATPGGDPAMFRFFTNVNQGVLFVATAWRGDLPKKWSLAQVAFWIWMDAVRDELPTENPALLDPSGLEYLIVPDILVDVTEDTIRYALSLVDGQTTDTTFEFEEPPDRGKPALVKQPFWALIGSPSGKVMMQLLVQRKESMGNKRLESVTVRYIRGRRGRQSDTFHMWAKYGESPQ